MRSAAAMTLSLARSSPTKTDRTQKEMKNAERAKSDLGRGARRADGGVEVPLSTSVIDTDDHRSVGRSVRRPSLPPNDKIYVTDE